MNLYGVAHSLLRDGSVAHSLGLHCASTYLGNLLCVLCVRSLQCTTYVSAWLDERFAWCMPN